MQTLAMLRSRDGMLASLLRPFSALLQKQTFLGCSHMPAVPFMLELHFTFIPIPNLWPGMSMT